MVGHSYLPNDWDFGGIETAQRKQQNVFVPAEWQELVRTARSKNPFSVTEMMTADFVSLAELKHTIVNWKKNTDKDKVEWLRIRWIHISQEKQLQLQYWYSLNALEPWKTINLKRKTKGRPPDMGQVALPNKYDGIRPIKDAKLKDLLQLLKYIPPVYHDFYHGLVGSEGVVNVNEDDSEDDGS